MYNIFTGTQEFDQDLSKWDVSKVTRMEGMFFQARVFNGDLSKWNVGQVTNMDNMFSGANSFNQDLSKWDVTQVVGMIWMSPLVFRRLSVSFRGGKGVVFEQ